MLQAALAAGRQLPGADGCRAGDLAEGRELAGVVAPGGDPTEERLSGFV